MEFYKANKANKGCGGQLSYCSARDKDNFCAWINLINQNGWDQSKNGGKGAGKFYGGESTTVKISIGELGLLRLAIQKRKDIKDYTNKNDPIFHTSRDVTSIINFGPYMKDGKYVGMTLRVSRSEKTSSKKSNFTLAFTPGEAEVVSMWIENALNHIFEGKKSLQIKKIQDKKKEQSSSQESDKSFEVDDNIPF